MIDPSTVDVTARVLECLASLGRGSDPAVARDWAYLPARTVKPTAPGMDDGSQLYLWDGLLAFGRRKSSIWRR